MGSYLHQIPLKKVRIPPGSPSELLVLARPQTAVEVGAAELEFLGDWFARWLALCLPANEELQDELLREISIWARSPPHRFVY
jgi:hypothetical protein